MGDAYIVRRGGSFLNFKVVGGTSAPANPAENTIWIDTDQEITSWIFSATAPEDPMSGMVWIRTTAISNISFNALKKNGILVYPIQAYQWDRKNWTSKVTKSYQGGEWVDWWLGELFVSGDEFKSFTGGWTYSGDGENTETYLRIGSTSATSEKNIYARTINGVSLSNFNTVKVHFVSGILQHNSSVLNIEAVDDTGKVIATKTVLSGATNPVPSTTGILDISKLTGDYHIQIAIYWSSDSGTPNIEYVDVDEVVCV